MTLLSYLGNITGDAFVSAGIDPAHGRVICADRPDIAQFQCNGALAAAGTVRKNPRSIAGDIADILKGNPVFRDVFPAGPGFINMILDDAFLCSRAALSGNARTPAWSAAEPEKIVMDYGGPNIAKPLHVGHLRAAIIGESLKRIFRYAGHGVVADIHLGDWGLPMGQLISALETEKPDLPYFDPDHDGPFPEEPPVTSADLEQLYPRAASACRNDPVRARKAREATARLQNGHPGYRALLSWFVTLSKESTGRDYADLGVSFDLWKGESDAAPYIGAMAGSLRRKGLCEHSDGAEIIRIAREGDRKEMPPFILFRENGSVLYSTTDLATIVSRVRNEKPDRIIYVVDRRQTLHFEQVFRVSQMAGFFPEDRLEHIGFGTMNGKDGKPFKTREGGVLKLRDLIDMVTDLAAHRLAGNALIQGSTPETADDIARMVGIAALKFADLSAQRMTDYVFDMDRFMSFEGRTGPYLLYACVRIRSILKKADARGLRPAETVTVHTPEERDLVLKLALFGDVIEETCTKRMPHILCEHAFGLARLFSRFYTACPVIAEPDSNLSASRLALAGLCGRQLDLSLSLLGIDVPESM